MRTVPLDITAPSAAPHRAPRTATDRCPTAIALHPAADGLIARVRLPGGRLTPAQARLLAAWAELPEGAAPMPGSDRATPLPSAPADRIEITGRGNLQIRGLRPEQAGPLAAALYEAGLLPSEPHDQARTIVASPLAGRLPGAAPIDALVRAVDEALCAAPELTALSGRFLIAIDDGTGEVDVRSADLALLREAPESLRGALEEPVTLLVGGQMAGRVPLRDAPAALVAAAHVFLELATGQAWQVRELGDGGRAVVDGIRAAGVVGRPGSHMGAAAVAISHRPHLATAALPPLGAGRQADGRSFVRVLPVLGRLTAPQLVAAAALAETAGTELRLATDRSLTLPDLAPKFAEPTIAGLAAAGLVVAQGDPAVGLTACAGLGCGKTRGDVRAAAMLRLQTRRDGAAREHLVGCDRRCGAPSSGTTYVLAEGESPTAFAARASAGAAQESSP